MNRSGLSVGLTVVVLAAAVSGCTQATPGQAAPGAGAVTPTTVRTPSVPRPTTTTSTAKPKSPMADTSPCDLVTDADLAQLGIDAAAREGKQVYARYCQFSESEFTASVEIYDELGPDKQVDGANGRKPVPTVGRHQAQQWIHAAGTCVVSMAVSQSTTVDASATDVDGNDQRSCAVALKLAQVVEPKLP